MTPATTAHSSLETFKTSLQKRLANNPAAFGPKIDIAALFPPQSTEKAFGDDILDILAVNDALRLLAETHRSIAMFFCVGFHPDVEKRLAFVDPFIDAMKESVKNKTYDEGFKIMVTHCQKLRELLYEAMYEGPYDEDKADSDPNITALVIDFQDFFWTVIESDCPDDGVEDEETAAAILRICEEVYGK